MAEPVAAPESMADAAPPDAPTPLTPTDKPAPPPHEPTPARGTDEERKGRTTPPDKRRRGRKPVRPHLDRSRLSETIRRPPHKRNLRSFTKLTGLQPMTRTQLNNSVKLKKTALSGLVKLKKTHSDQLLLLTNSLLLVGKVGGLLPSARAGRAILLLNEADNDYEDLSDGLYEYKEPKKPSSLDKSYDNLYGGLLLLSQSTGLTRKIAPEPFEELSGISFKARPYADTNGELVDVRLYQPQQLIFSNLQRTSSQFLGAKRSNASPTSHAGHPETRTQQRLWLQRENLLMDVAERQVLQSPQTSSAGSPPATPHESASNLLYLLQGQQNLIQLRTEFERLNREYVTVRRHRNPVAEALSRLERLTLPKTRKKATAATFKETVGNYEEREKTAAAMMGKLWLEALAPRGKKKVSSQ